MRARDIAKDLAELQEIADAIDREDPPHLVPDEALRRTVGELVDALVRRREDLNKFDPTGRLKRAFEVLRCELRRAGFPDTHGPRR